MKFRSKAKNRFVLLALPLFFAAFPLVGHADSSDLEVRFNAILPADKPVMLFKANYGMAPSSTPPIVATVFTEVVTINMDKPRPSGVKIFTFTTQDGVSAASNTFYASISIMNGAGKKLCSLYFPAKKACGTTCIATSGWSNGVISLDGGSYDASKCNVTITTGVPQVATITYDGR